MFELTPLSIILLLDYLALAFLFLYQYLKPGKETMNMAVAAEAYFQFYGMVLLLICSFFIALSWLSAGGLFALAAIPVVLVGLLFIAGMLLLLSEKGQAVLAMFVISVGLELYNVFFSPFMFSSPILSLFALAYWYMLGLIVILTGSQAVGFILRLLFPGIELRHSILLADVYGPGSDGRFRMDIGNANGMARPSVLAGVGIIYSLWMAIRLLLF
jgi:hypothetical protein